MYALRCLLPRDRHVCIDGHALVQCDEVDLPEKLSDQIVFYDSSGYREVISHNKLSELLSFIYIDKLLFVHEKQIREMLFSMSEPEHDSIDHLKDSFFVHSYVNPDISVRHIGIVNGIEVGYGVYAESELPVNDWIGEYVGVVQSISNSERQDSTSDAYAFLYPSCDSAYEINAAEYGNVIRFVNHSNNPNSKFQRMFYGGLWHIVVVSV